MTAAAILASNQRHQKALAVAHGDGTGQGRLVTIGGRQYRAAVRLAPVMPRMREDGGGTQMVQTGTATILKTALTAAPSQGTTLTLDAIDYTIISVGGRNAMDQAWSLKLLRLP